MAAARAIFNTKLTTDPNDYCNEFQRNLISLNNSAESMAPQERSIDGVNSFAVAQGLASMLFVLGTEDIPCLDTWQQTRIFTADNAYVPLEKMMATMRQVNNSPADTGRTLMATRRNFRKSEEKPPGYDDERCKLCRHRHLNKDCFTQHPELVPRRKFKNRRENQETARVNMAE